MDILSNITQSERKLKKHGLNGKLIFAILTYSSLLMQRNSKGRVRMDWKDCAVWLLRLATAGILVVGVLLGLADSKIF